MKLVAVSALTLILATGLLPGTSAKAQLPGENPNDNAPTVTCIVAPCNPIDSQPDNSDQPGLQFENPLEGLQRQVNDFLGQAEGFVAQAWESASQVLSDSLGALRIPDPMVIAEEMLNRSSRQTEAGKLAESMESRLEDQGSLATREDLNKEVQRAAVIATANGSTLSRSAQEQSAQALEVAQQATEQSITLGQDSQNSDVSQHILQNLSAQTALSQTTQESLLREAHGNRVLGAQNNLLTAQAASELTAMHTTGRREKISTHNQATVGSAMMTLPGETTAASER